ncbi:hypothetical protein Asera_17750 [Actinocatenispora sera]|uniref:Uncharacterized protein n=1 Tax=Actinocatenispora sera TaxID=390989 RepID=A0A810KXM4_9ACTN|nr:hypothetical protein Asera_17750 [Actinocatenispora sera]
MSLSPCEHCGAASAPVGAATGAPSAAIVSAATASRHGTPTRRRTPRSGRCRRSVRSEAAGSRGITRAILEPATKRAVGACWGAPSDSRYGSGDAGGPAGTGEPTAASPQVSTMDSQDRNGT